MIVSLGGTTLDKDLAAYFLNFTAFKNLESKSGDPSTIRTYDFLLRREILYPAELWGHVGTDPIFKSLKMQAF